MATQIENKPRNEEEAKIPVFTVLKNEAILKNIFIVNNTSSSQLNPMGNQDRRQEEILIIGRHPDCNVMLTHPSISRFHLKIVSNPSLQKLFVIDLSSVHGTWVAEKKIDPWDLVELKEGDSLRIGGSSRVYKLDWIPLSKAYDFETPYVSASDEPMQDEKEDDTCVEAYQADNFLLKENKEIQSLDMISLFSAESLGIAVKEIPSAPPISKNSVYSLFDENEGSAESPLKDVGEEKEIHFDDWIFGAESEKLSLPTEGVILDTLVSANDNDDQSLEPFLVTDVVCDGQSPVISLAGAGKESSCHFIDNFDSSCSEGRTGNQTPLREGGEMNESSLQDGTLLGESENEHVDRKDLTPENLCDVQPQSHEGKQGNCPAEGKPNLLVNFNSAYLGEVSPAFERPEETEDQNVYTKDHHNQSCSPCIEESVNSSFPAAEVSSEFVDDKENQTPQSAFVAARLPNSDSIGHSAIGLDKKPSFGSIWSRRGKPANAIQLQTGRNRMEKVSAGVDTEDGQRNQEGAEDKLVLKENFSCLNEEGQEIFTPDKENFTPNMLLVKSLKKKGKPGSVTKLRIGTEDKSISKEIFSCLSGEEEENFTPDKENFMPNTVLPKSLKKKGMLEEVRNSKPRRSSPLKATCRPTMHLEEDLVVSAEKKSWTLRVLQELQPVKGPTSGNQVKLEQELLVNRRRQERVPFQSLVVKSVGKTRSEALGTTLATKSSSSVSFTQTVEKKITNPLSNNSDQMSKRSWIMVADTTTLLNKESRKKLQLLQGLKGTRLIIPRMVIRELDCLRWRGSFFRRKTEAGLVLEWIERCMVETTSWIHVQSLAEDGRLTAPTPPASPQSSFSEGSGGFSYGTTSLLPFLCLESSMEVVSPTTEDHILECALLCRKVKSDGQLVLLSDDISLKIKAMAEGLICETVQEFRESLIHPFSERFLWAESSPRGQTWSFMDDVVSREKYIRCSLKKSLKGESAKGLKLILLHNSHYGQRTPIS